MLRRIRTSLSYHNAKCRVIPIHSKHKVTTNWWDRDNVPEDYQIILFENLRRGIFPTCRPVLYHVDPGSHEYLTSILGMCAGWISPSYGLLDRLSCRRGSEGRAALYVYKDIKLRSKYVSSLHRLRHCERADLSRQSLPSVGTLSFKSFFPSCV